MSAMQPIRTLVAGGRTRMLHTLSKNLVVCQADRTQQGAPPSASPRVPPPTHGTRPAPPGTPPPFDLELELVRLDEEIASGVVAIDRGEEPSNLGRIALLAGGDAAALLAFAAVGRLAHGEPLALADVVATASPFLAGWYAAAGWVGAFGHDAQGADTSKAAWSAAHAWAVGIPAGLVLRSIIKGYVPDTTFLMVSMAATGVFLIGWRTALAAATPAAPKTVREQLAARRDRRGNPFELLEMLSSMVRRW